MDIIYRCFPIQAVLLDCRCGAGRFQKEVPKAKQFVGNGNRWPSGECIAFGLSWCVTLLHTNYLVRARVTAVSSIVLQIVAYGGIAQPSQNSRGRLVLLIETALLRAIATNVVEFTF